MINIEFGRVEKSSSNKNVVQIRMQMVLKDLALRLINVDFEINRR